MKKAFFIGVIITFGGFISYGQNCKLVKTETDKFTNQTTSKGSVIVGKTNMFTGGVKWIFDFSQKKDNTTLKTTIAMTGEYNQVFGKDTKLMLLLDNDEVITYYNTIDSKPTTQAIAGTGVAHIFTNYILSFSLSKEDLQKLSNGIITDIKIEVTDQNIKPPVITSKQGKQIQEITNCLETTAI